MEAGPRCPAWQPPPVLHPGAQQHRPRRLPGTVGHHWWRGPHAGGGRPAASLSVHTMHRHFLEACPHPVWFKPPDPSWPVCVSTCGVCGKTVGVPHLRWRQKCQETWASTDICHP
eukprot:365698-Chlamydomonas_euryale.AAC.12